MKIEAQGSFTAFQLLIVTRRHTSLANRSTIRFRKSIPIVVEPVLRVKAGVTRHRDRLKQAPRADTVPGGSTTVIHRPCPRGSEVQMLRLLGPGARLCDGWNRREILRIGGLGVLGAGLEPDRSDLGRQSRRTVRTTRRPPSAGRSRASSCS